MKKIEVKAWIAWDEEDQYIGNIETYGKNGVWERGDLAKEFLMRFPHNGEIIKKARVIIE